MTRKGLPDKKAAEGEKDGDTLKRGENAVQIQRDRNRKLVQVQVGDEMNIYHLYDCNQL